MIYLSGHLRAGLPDRVGFIVQPRTRVHGAPSTAALFEGRPWAADNGCFATGDNFDLGFFLRWLERWAPLRPSCLFAVAPDVVGNAAATLDRSREPLVTIRDLGYPAALVAQDGLERVEVPWDTFDALFLGGTTRWKLSHSAWALAIEARQHGKWLHMGRVNSLRRLRIAEQFGCDSADGTFLAYRARARGHGEITDRGVPELATWMRTLKENPCPPLAD